MLDLRNTDDDGRETAAFGSAAPAPRGRETFEALAPKLIGVAWRAAVPRR